jgi:chemotaxis protein MotB
MKPSEGTKIIALSLLLFFCLGLTEPALAKDDAVAHGPEAPAHASNDNDESGKPIVGIHRRVDEMKARANNTDATMAFLSDQVEAAIRKLSGLEMENSALRGTALGLSDELKVIATARDQLDFKVARLTEEKDEILARLDGQVRALEDLLALERATTAKLQKMNGDRSAQLRASLDERDRIDSDLGSSQDALAEVQNESEGRRRAIAVLQKDAEILRKGHEALESHLAGETAAKETARALLEGVRARNASLSGEIAAAGVRKEVLDQQLAALRLQITELGRLLKTLESEKQEQQTKMTDLGRRLNLALAAEVRELARYRSEFFGRLREALRDRSDVHIVGDRFVFQSEVLFGAGESELEEPGRTQLRTLAHSLIVIGGTIPADIDWVLRVDGHTDARPIQTPSFPSNWELSTARAISVVKFLIAQGVPAQRVMAAGFAHYWPLDAGRDEIAFRRNRRIEFRLTEK